MRTLIEDAERRGASAINTALPRTMLVSENEVYKYAAEVCNSTTLPVIIQDYNPGGAVIGLDFVKRLSDEFDNFKFIKFEVSGIGALVKDILNATHEKVKVFSGWGGSYMLEQLPAGIAGIMPGIPIADYFIIMWKQAFSGNAHEAIKMFTAISPYLSFSLQNLEMFHHAEKRLAVTRGIMKSCVVRSVTVDLDNFQEKYLELIMDQVCNAIEEYGLKVKAN